MVGGSLIADNLPLVNDAGLRATRRAGVWQSGDVEKIERPLMGVALVFAVVMTVVGWYTAIRVGGEPAVVIPAILGMLAVVGGIWGWLREAPYWVAGGALGTGVLFPTVAGTIPMIIGFVLFILLVTLKIFNSTMDDGR